MPYMDPMCIGNIHQRCLDLRHRGRCISGRRWGAGWKFCVAMNFFPIMMRGAFVPLWLESDILIYWWNYKWYVFKHVQFTNQRSRCNYTNKLFVFLSRWFQLAFGSSWESQSVSSNNVEVKALACNDKWCIAVFLLVISGPSLRFTWPNSSEEWSPWFFWTYSNKHMCIYIY